MNKQELEKWIDEHKETESMQNGYFVYVDDLHELLKTHAILPREPIGKLVKSIAHGIVEDKITTEIYTDLIKTNEE